MSANPSLDRGIPLRLAATLLAAVVALAIVVALAFSLFYGMTTMMNTGPGGAYDVYMMHYEFEPPILHIRAGTTVRWVNMDMVDHTVSGSGMESGILGHMGTYAFTFTEPSLYDYICSLHPYMTASVVVA